MFKRINQFVGIFSVILIIFVVLVTLARVETYVLTHTDFIPYTQGWMLEDETNQPTKVKFNDAIGIENHKLTIYKKADNLMAYYGGLAFFTSELNMRVFVNEKKVYDTQIDRSRGVGISSGNIWNYVNLPNVKQGDMVRIEYRNSYCDLIFQNGKEHQISEGYSKINTPYVDHSREFVRLHPIFVGSNYAYTIYIIAKNLATFAATVAIILLGIATVISSCYSYYKAKATDMKHLIYFGVFMVFTGLYLAVSNHLLSIFVMDAYLLNELRSIFVLLAILGLAVSMIGRQEALWRKFGYICFIIAALSLGIRFVSYFNKMLYPFVYTISTDAYIYLAILAVGITELVFSIKYESKKSGWKIRFFVVGMASLDYFVMLFGIADSVTFRTFALLVYFFSRTTTEMALYLRIYEEAKEDSQYKILAGTDMATGLKNRITLNDNLELYDKELRNLSIVVMDVNGLKDVNDTQGHNKGDELLNICADLIKRFFGDIGDCYRIGGDEFMVVLNQIMDGVVNTRISQLKESMDMETKKGAFTVSMAIGIAKYTEYVDETMEDMIQRADKLMYKEKEKIKLQEYCLRYEI